MSDRDSDRPGTGLRALASWEGEIEERVRAYRAGDRREEHGRWLTGRIYPAIHGILRNQRIDAEEARDLTQDLVVRVFEKIEEYRFEAPFMAWVRRIVANALFNRGRDERVRRERARMEPLEVTVRSDEAGAAIIPHPALREEPLAEANAQRAELRVHLRRALDQVPPAMRRCLWMFALGFTYQEIADALGISLNTVRSQISHGYRRLRPILAPLFPEYPSGGD